MVDAKKQYELDMKRVSTKSKRLATALAALHEGEKPEQRYDMMSKFMKAHDLDAPKEDLEGVAERIEKNVEEKRAAKQKPQERKYLDPETHTQWISEAEYTRRAKELLEDRNNR